MDDLPIIMNADSPDADRSASALLPMVYEELRRLAYARMSTESLGHTLQPTALVHEAWIRMVDNKDRTWQNKAYFFSAAAIAMRRILVDHARRKMRIKHGGGQQRLNIDELEVVGSVPDEKILLVEEALNELEQVNEQRAKVVVMKYYGEMTNREVAEALGIGERTVDRHWACAKVWLFEKIRAKQ